jgi:hypothetical protein
MIAPFWAIESTASAYAAIKYANAVVMCLAAVPTYLLARMLVPRRAALVVALLAVCIPGMAYVTSIVPEVLAYPWYALCSWLVVRALASRRPLDVVLALAASGAALLVRPKLGTILLAFGMAAFWMWLTGPRGRALRAGWSRMDTIGAIVLALGALFLLNRVVLQHVTEWQVATEYWKDRMVDLGLRAGLAFTVGMGVLPVVAGLASLRLPGRRGDPVYRAFVLYFAASIVTVGLYAATKAAYLSTMFATLTIERNLIYLAPLMLIGAAMVLLADEIDWRVVGAASVFVGYLFLAKGLELQFPYFEAPGFAILTIGNRSFGWDAGDLQLALLVALAVSLLVIALRRQPLVPIVAAAVVLVWLQTGQIQNSRGINDLAGRFRANLPAELDWIDRATGRAPVTYLGQAIQDPNGIWLTEFWNRSLQHVQSLDDTAPGPGPALTPDLVAPDGTLARTYDTPYVVADNGVTLDAQTVVTSGRLTLYRVDPPWRLLDAVRNVSSDGWAPESSSYTYYKPGQRGHLEVTLARTGYNGDAPPGRAVIRVGEVRINSDLRSELGRMDVVRRAVVENGSSQTLRIPVAETPVRVEITVTPTFQPSEFDRRHLGAQVSFRFVPEARG